MFYANSNIISLFVIYLFIYRDFLARDATNTSLTKKSRIICDNCFLYSTPKLRNSLPNNITSQSNVNSF